MVGVGGPRDDSSRNGPGGGRQFARRCPSVRVDRGRHRRRL